MLPADKRDSSWPIYVQRVQMVAVIQRVPSLDVKAEPELQVQGTPGTENPQDSIHGPRRKNMSWGGHTVGWTSTQ